MASRAQRNESLVQQAQLAATALEQQLTAHRQTLETVVLLAQGDLETNVRLKEYLDSIVKTRPEWFDLQIVNANGKVISAQSNKPPNLSGDWVNGIKTQAERKNAFVVSADQSGDGKLHFFSLAQPVGNGNFVVARVDVTGANAVFESLDLPEDNIIAVFDVSNRLVYRNRIVPEQMSLDLIETPLFSVLNEKREGVIEVESPYDGIDRVYGLAPVNPGNYVVAVGVPSSRLYEPARQQFARQAFFGLLIASLAIAAAFAFARNIVRPLHELTKVAHAFGEGDAAARADVAEGRSIGALGLTFNNMADRIAQREEKFKQLDRLRSEFVSSVSHELRTPLTTIKTLTHVLKSEKISVIERSEYLQTIADECDRQIEFVQNLLDLSRIESGSYRVAIGPIDVVKLLSEVTKINGRVAEARNLSLLFAPPRDISPAAIADYGVLRQVIVSLIENAIKYTPENGTIRLAVRRSEGRIVIEISDNGCGIAADDIPHVFEKFFRGRPLSSPAEEHVGDEALEYSNENSSAGLGLGLYLVKNRVGQMGGELFVQSPSGLGKRGTAISILLPEAKTVAE